MGTLAERRLPCEVVKRVISGRNTGTPAAARTAASFFSHRAAVRSAAHRSTLAGNKVGAAIRSFYHAGSAAPFRRPTVPDTICRGWHTTRNPLAIVIGRMERMARTIGMVLALGLVLAVGNFA